MSKLDVVSIRLVKDAPIMSDKPIGNPIAAVELLGKQLCDMDREVLCVINLKANGVPINCNFVSMGAVDQTVAHPRELFKSAILSNASSMLLLHNHPSGNLTLVITFSFGIGALLYPSSVIQLFKKHTAFCKSLR